MRRRARVAGCLVALLSAAPAIAQISGSVAVASDVRFRGRSMTAGRPAATASLSYDDASGVYLNGYAVVAEDERGRIAPAGGQVNIGYARRIGDTLGLDLGLMRTRLRRSGRGGQAVDYDEVYVGVTGRRLSAYVHAATRARGSPVAYGQVAAAIPLSTGWRLAGHAGLSVLAARAIDRTAGDADVSLIRRSGAIDYRISWSIAERYAYRRPRAAPDRAVTAGIAYSF